MDRYYLTDLIRRIEEEKDCHNKKFAGVPVHDNCLPRFDSVLDKLRQELAAAIEAGPPRQVDAAGEQGSGVK